MPNLEIKCVLHFEFHRQKLFRIYHNTYVLLFCIDVSTKPYKVYDLIEQITRYFKMFVKVYTIFFLSLGGCNFKVSYLKDKMKHEMWVHILVCSLKPYIETFWHSRSKCYEQAVKFYPEIFEGNVLVRWNN